MKIIDVFRMKFVIFMIQILILSFCIFLKGYEFNIVFDVGILEEQAFIIQILANYILFNKLSDLYFIYIIWILVSLIPILAYKDFKKAYSMNLQTYFFPNFFFYAFLRRHSRSYFNSYFQFHILHTILLGIVIVGFSIGLTLIIKKITKGKSEPQIADLEAIARSITTICPHCGTEFESIPKFCYNCNSDLTIKIEDKSE